MAVVILLSTVLANNSSGCVLSLSRPTFSSRAFGKMHLLLTVKSLISNSVEVEGWQQSIARSLICCRFRPYFATHVIAQWSAFVSSYSQAVQYSIGDVALVTMRSVCTAYPAQVPVLLGRRCLPFIT